MNAVIRRKMPLAETVDVLLADVAVRVQLSQTNYSLAVSRYQTINKWIERDESPLKDKVAIFYPQGSMAVGATIASKVSSDEFDIDLIAQLMLPADTPPHVALSILEDAIRGKPGSRYYDMTTRCTRCVQVQYDGMHLDVTPMVRLHDQPERTGYIFHARSRIAQQDDRRIVANPYGFAQWFKQNTPLDYDFQLAFGRREALLGIPTVRADADIEPVPTQAPPHSKSMALITLQLLKRWRNIRYAGRSGRKPASVMLAKLVATAANQTETLSEELLHQARSIYQQFLDATAIGRLVVVENPACRGDVFTDRWPATLDDQRVFLADLKNLVAKLEVLCGDCDLSDMRKILSELFGERPTAEVIDSFVKSNGSPIVAGDSHHTPGAGRFAGGTQSIINLATSSASAAPATLSARPTPKHTFFGGGSSE